MAGLTGEGVGEGDQGSHAFRRSEGTGVPFYHKDILPALGDHLLASLVTEARAKVHHINGLELVQWQVL